MTQATDYQVRHEVTGSDPKISYTVYDPQDRAAFTLVFASGTGLTQDCWRYRWADYFAQRGVRCITLDYRAHGSSVWSYGVRYAKLSHYVEDLECVVSAESLEYHQLIPIGHSMGGGIALRYAEQHELLGLIVTGAFSFGLWNASSRAMLPYLARRHPLVLLRAGRNPSVLFNTEKRAREFLLGAADDETVQACLHCIGSESGAVLSELVKVQPEPLRVPAQRILFLGASDDRLAPVALVRQSAASINAQFREVPGPHMMMMAPSCWQEAADEVLRFAHMSSSKSEQQERGQKMPWTNQEED